MKKILLILMFLIVSSSVNAEENVKKVIKVIETKNIHNVADISNLPAIKKGKATYSEIKKEVTITLNESPNKECWRLVWDDKKNVIDLFESTGTTRTYHNLYCGTEEECLQKIRILGLVINEGIDEIQSKSKME